MLHDEPSDYSALISVQPGGFSRRLSSRECPPESDLVYPNRFPSRVQSSFPNTRFIEIRREPDGGSHLNVRAYKCIYLSPFDFRYVRMEDGGCSFARCSRDLASVSTIDVYVQSTKVLLIPSDIPMPRSVILL